MRHWTQAERLQQAQLIQRWKPWRLAGVKTEVGKQRSKMNSLKDGAHCAELRAIASLLAEHKRTLKKIISMPRQSLIGMEKSNDRK